MYRRQAQPAKVTPFQFLDGLKLLIHRFKQQLDSSGTVRGFFAGLKKRQGITVEIAERIRQVGPNKQGAKGSYTVYHVAE